MAACIFDHFSHHSNKVMRFAKQEAREQNQDCIGTEHILLGLIKDGSTGTGPLKNF